MVFFPRQSSIIIIMLMVINSTCWIKTQVASLPYSVASLELWNPAPKPFTVSEPLVCSESLMYSMHVMCCDITFRKQPMLLGMLLSDVPSFSVLALVAGSDCDDPSRVPRLTLSLSLSFTGGVIIDRYSDLPDAVSFFTLRQYRSTSSSLCKPW